ncbi:MAG: TRAM domain-containing protein [Propionibacteriaceae bacterium]|jgi:tRNA/tmRNA/rRNA uracil-C5-methylase (TrmA/RlmC/RlmD family)|nr:TRAM domain-containing protein [Propionibacteriaceae bacterium]
MIITVTTTDVAHGGVCVARHEGIVVFVSGGLPHEVLEVEVTEKKKNQWYARTIEVNQASPDRVPHVWPLAQTTGVGGADLGHVSLDAQRRWKATVIEHQMRRMAHLDLSVSVEPAPIDSENHGLAWRTRVSVKTTDQGLLGMNAHKSHEIIPVDGMPLTHEQIQKALAEDLTRTHPPGKIMGYVYGSTSGLTRVGSKTSTVHERVETSFGTWSYEVAADGFWQVHRQAPQILVEAVLDAIGETHQPIIDLYCGAGLFSIPLADFFQVPVTAVESSPLAVQYLRRNAHGFDVTPVRDDASTTLRTHCVGAAGTIVCDPPRSGVGVRGVREILRVKPEKVVYVACDPATLARDLGLFVAQGYDLINLRAFDLFPMTHHVEAVAVLSKTL